MNEEEILKRITGLLGQGCTMLAQHHDCGAPLFRCKGEILCPVCSFGTEARMDLKANEAKTLISNDSRVTKGAHDSSHDKDSGKELLSKAISAFDHAKGSQESGQQRLRSPLQSPEQDSMTAIRQSMEPIASNATEIKGLLRTALLNKLEELSGNIRKEQDLSQLRAMLDCIEVALRILRCLNEET